ncbi:hypothetical protein Tco_1063899 [Tanacetum coccineum]
MPDLLFLCGNKAVILPKPQLVSCSREELLLPLIWDQECYITLRGGRLTGIDSNVTFRQEVGCKTQVEGGDSVMMGLVWGGVGKESGVVMIGHGDSGYCGEDLEAGEWGGAADSSVSNGSVSSARQGSRW